MEIRGPEQQPAETTKLLALTPNSRTPNSRRSHPRCRSDAAV